MRITIRPIVDTPTEHVNTSNYDLRHRVLSYPVQTPLPPFGRDSPT